ncbi:MAG: D-aminoacyl-tRNA deacylase [Bacteroidales bacterium]|nr:D-aminoacyl-tRNA deacylase [Bacteroidales bacterium]MDY0216972.1 D-aminoacyl-tRNA deacylase [Bacteroidales bacterium]
MRALIQRVSQSKVTVENKTCGEISKGLLVLLGIEDSDTQDDVDWLCRKISQLRIFDDTNGVMNLSLQDVQGQTLIISQFTLHASTKKGNRPSYIRAASPEFAKKMYEDFVANFKKYVKTKVATGIFGAMMKVELINDGPVTIFIDTKNKE